MTRAALLILPLLFSGCTLGIDSLEVELSGTLHSEDGDLTFSKAGYPSVYGRPMRLSRAQEDVHYGVVLVDSTALPAGWRPEHAPDGGVLVAAVDRASPLAIAGLRGKDLVRTVDGRAVKGPQSLAEILAKAGEVTLGITSAESGEEKTITAKAVEDVRAVSSSGLLGVFEWASTATGSGLRLGPLGTIFDTRSVILTDDHRYVESSSWGFLFDLFVYETETDLLTGKSQSRFRLLWFIEIGDSARGL